MHPELFGLLAVAAILAILVVLKWFRPFQTSALHEWPFYVKRPLSQPEQVLYHRLRTALPDHVVLAQVQVSRVLGVKKGFKFHHWNNRINRLSYDFVVCMPDASVVAVIELDDKSHEARSRREADRRKEKATRDAGLQLIRWYVAALPDQETIQAAFRQSGQLHESRPAAGISG